MHYYPFNISDYLSHTTHLDPLEDIAYRRMIDWQYLHERPLPLDIEYIAKAIRMRTHSDCITFVLQEFFQETPNGYISPRIDREIAKYQSKREKASKSAKARWDKNANANALQTQSEGNANQEPITNNQETITISRGRFTPPSLHEVREYFAEKNCPAEAEKFFHFYESKNWMVGKNKMQKWKSSAAGWISRNGKNNTASEYAHTWQGGL